jgi:hypothetical protein
MSGRTHSTKRKIEQNYLNAIQNLKFSSTGENSTKGNVIQNLRNNIIQLKTLKSQISALFLDSGSNFEKYDTKLKNAKQDHSKKLYLQKVDRYRGEVLELVQKMEIIDESIKNMEDTITKLLQEGIKEESSVSLPTIPYDLLKIPQHLKDDASVIYHEVRLPEIQND